MIDALLYAVRDGIRAAGMNYGKAECDIMDDDRPPPRCGNFFVSVHDGEMRSNGDNQLHEWYSFKVTLTARVTIPLDRVGTEMMALNVARVPLAQRKGFYAKADQLRALLHMNWRIVVLPGQTPPSANDNLVNWSDGLTTSIYGFDEPARFRGMENPKLVGGEWFAADPESEEVGMKATLRFADARRFQPVAGPSGPFF